MYNSLANTIATCKDSQKKSKESFWTVFFQEKAKK